MNTSFKAALLLLSLAALPGCSSMSERTVYALNAGNFALAEQNAMAAIQEGDPYGWNNLGVVYARTGRRDEAVKAYTMAARYGIPVAQQNLIVLNQPVPTADLATGSLPRPSSTTALDAGLSLLNSAADGYTQGKVNAATAATRLQTQSPPKQVKCETRVLPGFSPPRSETICK